MRNFILFILIVVLFYYLFKWVVRIIFPTIANKAANSYYKQNYANKNKKEGEVTIENMPKKNKKYKKDDGEYVDYEEV